MVDELAEAGGTGVCPGLALGVMIAELTEEGEAAGLPGSALGLTVGELVDEGEATGSLGLTLGLAAGVPLLSAVRSENWGDRKVFVPQKVAPTAAKTASIDHSGTNRLGLPPGVTVGGIELEDGCGD